MIHPTTCRFTAITVLAVSLVLVLAGCSTTPTASKGTPATKPASPGVTTAVPTIKVVSPVDGTVVEGSDLSVRVETTGLEFVDPSNTTVPGQGHVHFTLDDQPVQMSVTPDYTLKNITPGKHTLRSELVQNDTTPFAPAVFQTVTFTVK
jgi:hypothetical protein